MSTAIDMPRISTTYGYQICAQRRQPVVGGEHDDSRGEVFQVAPDFTKARQDHRRQRRPVDRHNNVYNRAGVVHARATSDQAFAHRSTPGNGTDDVNMRRRNDPLCVEPFPTEDTASKRGGCRRQASRACSFARRPSHCRLLAFAASADTVAPGEEGELTRFLQPVEGKRVCFARIYDADHLAKHPKQKVTQIEFRLAYHRFEPDENFPQGQRNYYFEVLAKVRGEKKLLSSMGECSPRGSTISCSVDCDGGGMIAKRSAKPGKILMSFGGYYGLRMTLGCGEDEEATLSCWCLARRQGISAQRNGACPAYGGRRRSHVGCPVGRQSHEKPSVTLACPVSDGRCWKICGRTNDVSLACRAACQRCLAGHRPETSR